MHAQDEPLTDLERRLKGWTPAPAPAGPDRDRLLFEAGRASARVARWIPLAGAACLIAAMGLGIAWSREVDRRRRLEREVIAFRSGANQEDRRQGEPQAPQPALAEASGPTDPSSSLALSRDLASLGDRRRIGAFGPTVREVTPEGPDRPILSPLRARHGEWPADLCRDFIVTDASSRSLEGEGTG